MYKRAQLPSQYTYGYYTPDMDSMGLLPGTPTQQPQTTTPNWLLPVGLAAGGLATYGLLRGAGRGAKQGIQRLIARLRRPKTTKNVDTSEPWNWEMEMLGRDVTKAPYRSSVTPREPVGHGYGPGPEAIFKQGSAASRVPALITALNRISRSI